MKYIYLSLLLGFFSFNVFSQIGVSTANPQALFHVDAAKNNNATGAPTAAQAIDDFVITSTGRVGVGTVNPQTKLHIVTGGTAATPKIGLRLEDGAQKNTYLLRSDANGYAKWAIVPKLAGVSSVQPDNPVNVSSSQTSYIYTGAYIDLDPGKWMVTVNTLLYGTGGTPPLSFDEKVWVHASFITTSVALGAAVAASAISTDVQNQKKIAALANKRHYSMLIGSLIINNTSAASKRYYYVFGAISQIGTNQGATTFGGVQSKSNSENSITALPIYDNF